MPVIIPPTTGRSSASLGKFHSLSAPRSPFRSRAIIRSWRASKKERRQDYCPSGEGAETGQGGEGGRRDLFAESAGRTLSEVVESKGEYIAIELAFFDMRGGGGLRTTSGSSSSLRRTRSLSDTLYSVPSLLLLSFFCGQYFAYV